MSREPTNATRPVQLEAVPLFPLPNLVLFPNALLPLHIFEERYKAMTADALAGKRQIAMALLSPGWENSDRATPAIDPVVCVGSIVSYERFVDGTYNLLLRGEFRGLIDRELAPSGPASAMYRVAHLSRVVESDAMEIDLGHERERMEALLTESWLTEFPLVGQIRALLRSAMRTADIADLIAFHLLEDVALKQTILAEGDIRARVNCLLSALNAIGSPLVSHCVPDDAPFPDPSTN